nr:unnamed protein product [Naegleria fowleri]
MSSQPNHDHSSTEDKSSTHTEKMDESTTNGTASASTTPTQQPSTPSRSTPKKRTTTPSNKVTPAKRYTPVRSTRGKLPSHLEDYQVGDFDLRQVTNTTSSSSNSSTPKKKKAATSSTPKKAATPKRKKEDDDDDDEAEMSDDDNDAMVDDDDFEVKPKKSKQRKTTNTAGRAKKATASASSPSRRTGAAGSSSSSTPSRTGTNRPTNISLNNLPSDDSAVLRSRTPGNRFSEFQSSHIDYEEALRKLLAKTPGNEFKRGDVDATHWAISSLPMTEMEYFDTNTLVNKKITLQQILSGCYYAEGNRRLKSSDEVPAVQICFAFDTTGSQINIIDDLKWKLQHMCQQLLNDIPTIQISIIAFGDYADYSMFYVMQKLDFSNDIDQIVSFVQSLRGTGGLDPAECYEMVLKEAQTLSWIPKDNPFTQRTLVVIGDDVPHSTEEYLKINYKEEASKLFNEYHIKIHSVQCQGRDYATDFYQFLADETGGRRFELKDFDSMQNMFLGLCYREAGEFQMANPSMQQHLKSSSAIVRPGGSSSQDSDSGDASDLSDEEMKQVHEAIHNPAASKVTIKGVDYDISVNDGACRFVRIGEVTYMEQNKDKGTKYAKMAIEGKKITWITRRGQWGLIIDDEIKIR